MSRIAELNKVVVAALRTEARQQRRPAAQGVTSLVSDEKDVRTGTVDQPQAQPEPISQIRSDRDDNRCVRRIVHATYQCVCSSADRVHSANLCAASSEETWGRHPISTKSPTP